MSHVHYAVRFRLDHKDRWLIWHSDDSTEGNEQDGVVIDQNGLMLVFRSQRNCITYAAMLGLMLVDEQNSAFFNLDIVEKWQ
ncbi:MAG: hypothetical protein ACRYFS_24835 [Janthinobacterium lividum]